MVRYRNIACPIFLFFLLLFCGCSTHAPNDRHARYFDPVFKKFDDADRTRMDLAVLYLDSAFRAFPNPSPGDIYSYDSMKSIWVFNINNDYAKSLAYNDSMIAISKSRLDDENYAKRYYMALYERGDRLKRMKKYDAAFEYYQLAHEAELKYNKGKCNTGRYNRGIGYIMFDRERYLLAANYFLKEYEDFNSPCIADPKWLLRNKAFIAIDIYTSYFHAGLLDSSYYYQKEALKIIENKSAIYASGFDYSKYISSIVYSDQADGLANIGKYAEAEDLYKKSIAGTIRAFRAYTQVAQVKLAELYLKQGKRDLFTETMKALKGSLDTLNMDSQMMSWLKIKSKYFQQEKQMDSAFSYLEKFDELRESIYKRNTEVENVDVREVIQNPNLKNFNKALQRDSQLKSLLITVAILVFIMAGAIAILIWKNLKRTRKLNMRILEKNNELERAFGSLEQSHAENTHIMRVVAHDLKNPISAMQNIMYGLLQREQPANKKKMFEDIRSSCSNSLLLINELLEERKRQSKKAEKIN